jgi:putative ABC transport system ATP-binding protein
LSPVERGADLLSLTAREVCLRLGGVDVLNGVELSLGSRESIAVMGASGSGKTSLLHVLSGLILPDSGTVTFGNVQIAGLSEKQRRAFRLQRIGFVFQSGDLIPELTFVENVSLPLLLQGERRGSAATRAREALASVGVEALADRKPAAASGGQRQRAAIARAIVHRPRVIFADEPTGALDADSAEMVLPMLLGRASERGAGVIVVTHDPVVAARCDRTLFHVGGRLSPTPSVLVTDGA